MTQRPRIGVFVCDCGGGLAESVNMAKLKEQLSALPDVVTVSTVPFGCSTGGELMIKDTLRKVDADRILLLGCSPRMIEERFRRICHDVGLNPSLLEIVNIRDQCARVSGSRTGPATRKAWRMVQMGLARIRMLTPIEATSTEIRPDAVVIGGGVAGMTATLELARQNIPVTLVERSGRLGGAALDLAGSTPESAQARQTAEQLAKAVASASGVTVLLNTEVAAADGTHGNHRLALRTGDSDRTVECGSIILATGAGELQPDGKHGHGSNPKVITQSELERRLADQRSLAEVRNVVMLQCVGARTPERPYCGRICCRTTVDNAIALKEAGPERNVTILHRGVPPEPDMDQATLDRASGLGVRFVRLTDEAEPVVTPALVRGKRADGRGFRAGYDLVVLATPPVPSDGSRRLAEQLRVPVDRFGFIPDTIPDLKPHMYAETTVHVAGSARWPCGVKEATYQAYGRAARIAALARAGTARRLVIRLASTSACAADAAPALRSAPSGSRGFFLATRRTRHRASTLACAWAADSAWCTAPRGRRP